LCEILTGKPPYVASESWRILYMAALGDHAEALARLDGCGVDAELVALAKECLNPDAAARPRNAGEVARQVGDYQRSVQERLRLAEYERAAAEARAQEAKATARAEQAKALAERRMRRQALALVAAVLVLVGVGGLVGWQRAQRRAAGEREVAGLVGEAKELLQQGWHEADDAVRWGETLKRAEDLLQRADGLVGRGEVGVQHSDAVRGLTAALAQDKADQRLAANLERIRLLVADSFGTRRSNAASADTYRRCLANHGLDLFGPNRKEVLVQLQAHRLRERLWNALWYLWLRSEGGQRDSLDAVLDAIGGSEGVLLAQWREAVRRRDKGALTKLSQQPQVRALPVSGLFNLARALSELGVDDAATDLLTGGLERFPDDFWLNFELGRICLRGRRATRPDEAVRYLTAAVALRKSSFPAWVTLGDSLTAKGDAEGAIRCFGKAIDLDRQDPAAHNGMGKALAKKKDITGALDCYRKAIDLDPNDPEGHFYLGWTLWRTGKLDDAIAEYRKAIGLDPKQAELHYCLGQALQEKEELAEAIDCYRKAIELDPEDADWQNGLGNALLAKRDRQGAISCYCKAIDLDPRNTEAHHNLGQALQENGELDEAICCYRKAIHLDPAFAKAHHSLGMALKDKGKADDAIRCFRRVTSLEPKIAWPYSKLGDVLAEKGELDEAIRCYRQAIDLEPGFAEAYCYLGHVLQRQGRLAESLAAFRRGHELGSRQTGWRYLSTQWLRRAEALVDLEVKLPAVLERKYRPVDNKERLDLARVCVLKKRYLAAARLYAEAFAAEPKRANNLATQDRYSAACCAALAAACGDEDAATLDDQERHRWRRRALSWLRADLVLWTKLTASWLPGQAERARQVLQHWQQDSDLTSIRDAAPVGNLPADQREACQKLWADVTALLQKRQEKR
jgi:tetratricopeptide (TPR) repeat protein